MPAVGGDFTLTIGGKQMVTMGDCTVRPSGKTRELIESIARDGKPRYTERSTPGQLSVTFVVDADQSIGDILAIANATGTLESVSGKTYRLSNLTRTGEVPEIDQAAGTYPVVFVGHIEEQS